MKIERATLREIPLRLKEVFAISSGGSQDRRVVLLTLEGDGLEGWSECVAASQPAYAYETVDVAWHVLTDFNNGVLMNQHILGERRQIEKLLHTLVVVAETRWLILIALQFRFLAQ